MPEKTRDRKNWFPRFKSNWLGTYRSKQMFLCCECAVTDAESARYKGAEGKHCVCGRDQWHLAKSVEETEYNRRMEISKSFGGIRYEEAVERIKGMGGSEYEFDDKRVRCESDDSAASTVSMRSTESMDYPTYKRIKTEVPSPSRPSFSHELKLSMGPNPAAYNGYDQQQQPPPYKSYPAAHNPTYNPLPADMLASTPYDHLAPPTFTDEESFGELLQGILEDDPRNHMHAKMAHARAAAPYAHMKRYPETAPEMEFSFYPSNAPHGMHPHGNPQHYHQHHQQPPHPAHHHNYGGYQQPHGFVHHHHPHMVPPVATASFPSAV